MFNGNRILMKMPKQDKQLAGGRAQMAGYLKELGV